MFLQLPRRLNVATPVLSFLCLCLPPHCFGQVAIKASEITQNTAAHSSVRDELSPFDELELFGFLAAGPSESYAKQIIEARGATFTPDATFMASFANPSLQEMLRSIRARSPRAISPDRDAAYELLRRAWVAQQHRFFAAASETYQRALDLAPNSAALHLAYALNLLFLRDYSAAETQSRNSLKLWPENAEAHASLALSLTAQKQFAEAESESRESLRIFPDNHSAMLALGISLTHEEKFKEAIPILQKLIAASPKMPEPRKALGISQVKTGEIDEGTNQLRFYLQNAPQDAEAHYYLGVALRSKGHSEEAALQFAEALRLQPNNLEYEAAAHPFVTRSTTDEALPGPKPEDGSISENIYTNKFFGFMYEFPNGWIRLSSDAARAALEAGGRFISGGDDPTQVDARAVAERKGHPLLYVVEDGIGKQSIPVKTVMVTALDIGTAPELAPGSFLKSVSERFKHTGAPLVINEAPAEIALGGRSFWKATFAVQTTMGSIYTTEFVTADKGYFLIFVISSQGPENLHEVEKSLESVRFFGTPN